MIVGGCKSKKEGLGALGDANVSISENSFSNIENVLKVPSRKVTDKEGEAALKAVGFWEKNKKLTWESRSGGKGTYTFKNVSGKKGKETFLIKTLKFTGLHQIGSSTNADLLEASDIEFATRKGSMTIKNAGLRGITIPTDFSDLARSNALSSGGDAEGVAAFVINGIKGATADGTNFDVSQLGWGQDPKDNHLRFAVDDFTLNGTAKGGDAFSMSLDMLQARGLNPVPAGENGEIPVLKLNAGLSDILSTNPQVGNFIAKDMSFKSDILSMALPKMVQTAKAKGDVQHLNFSMPKMTIEMNEVEGMSGQERQMFGIMKSAGFDKMELSSEGKTLINETADFMDIQAASFDLKDGFDLNYSGALSGLNAMRLTSLDSAASQADIQGAQNNVKLHGFALSLEDKSIVDRGFALAGEMMGQSPENLRRQANGVLALGSLAALTQDDGKIYSELSKAVGEFIQDGGTLNIAMQPDQPMSLTELQGLTQGNKPDLKRLGFSSSTTK